MKQCKICKEVKFSWQFWSEKDYVLSVTWISDICKKCAKEIGNRAVKKELFKTKQK